MNGGNEFQIRLRRHAKAIQHLLDGLLSPQCLPGEIVRPVRLVDAVRHAVLNGGKRLRPFLLIECALLFRPEDADPIFAGAALECVHCYSLIHDDLPAMDDDDLRRGRPTVHRAFDEATAILAGDCLQSLAFDMIANPRTHPDPAIRSELVTMLARACGIGGMAGGQMLDLEAQGITVATEDIRTMQSMKTGALFRFACEAGAVVGGAQPAQRAAISRFGTRIGTAFQLADDILDVTASTEALGKRAAKDAGRGKATVVARDGLEAARESAGRLLEEALAELSPLALDTSVLAHAAHFIVERNR